MREAGPRISRLAPNAQMRPSAKGASFLQESGSQLPIEILYFFILENAIYGTMKQQITLGLGKTKGDISEISYGALFKAYFQYIFNSIFELMTLNVNRL